jgi:hypothetical protein
VEFNRSASFEVHNEDVFTFTDSIMQTVEGKQWFSIRKAIVTYWPLPQPDLQSQL